MELVYFMVADAIGKNLSTEIKMLAETFEVQRFEPLSAGIGLGEMLPQLYYRREPDIGIPTATGSQRKLSQGQNVPVHITVPIKQTAKNRALKVTEPPVRYKSLLLWPIAHMIDLVVVVSISIIGFLAIDFFSKYFVHLPRGTSLHKTIQHLGLLKMLAGIYLVFSVYWLMLRILSGTTIGGSWRISAARPQRTVTAKVKH